MNPPNSSNPTPRKHASRVPQPAPSAMQRRPPTVVLARVVEPEPLPPAEPEVYEDIVGEPLPPVGAVDDPPQGAEPPLPPADPYMELYAQYIRLQEENLRLRRKTMRLEEDLKHWKDKKATKRAKLEGEELKNAIVDIILNSGMNIESIPDDVERELYGFILTQLSNGAGAVSCVRRLFFCG